MNSRDLLDQAEHLAKRSPKRPKQADLRRAVSASYYAAFHALCRLCADTLIGVGASRADKAWAQAYRAVDHGAAKSRCASVAEKGFPVGVISFAGVFRSLQEQRHRADYDPMANFTRSEVVRLIGTSRHAIAQLAAVTGRDRKAFAAHILLPYRN